MVTFRSCKPRVARVCRCGLVLGLTLVSVISIGDRLAAHRFSARESAWPTPVIRDLLDYGDRFQSGGSNSVRWVDTPPGIVWYG
jgi:hypothetical protein